VEAVLLTTFSRSRHLPHPGHDNRYDLGPLDLKLPFAVTREEIEAFRMPDVRLGGFGPLFGGSVLLAVAALAAATRRGLRWPLLASLLALPILVSVLVFPHPWFARYVPQGWLLPLLLAAVAWAAPCRWARALAVLTVAAAVANAGLVAAGHLPATVGHSALLKGRLLELAKRRDSIELDLQPFPSNRARLQELGIPFTSVHDPFYRLQVYLGSPQPRIASVLFSSAPESGQLAVVEWLPIPQVDSYLVEAVQPPPAGPGGGALTVARRSAAGSSAELPVPSGPLHILVSAQNGVGRAPAVSSGPHLVEGPDPRIPRFGVPEPDEILREPRVLLSWLPVRPQGSDAVIYNLEVEEAGSAAPIAELDTSKTYHALSLASDGSWIARLSAGSPSGSSARTEVVFHTEGVAAPTLLAPASGEAVAAGEVALEWSRVPEAGRYEYFVAVQGEPEATVRGITEDSSVRIVLEGRAGSSTVYSAIVRACLSGDDCRAGSELGWGPWSVDAGSGAVNFMVAAAPVLP
jgi:hypothetical protein